jgi:tRNA (adenine22-N1)-methyltransferase
MTRRLLLLASLCPHDAPLVDIGSDHGYLPQALIKQGFTNKLYATELSEASFRSLQYALQEHNVIVYQANGFLHLPDLVKTAVLTGMGGQLIINILSQYPEQTRRLTTLVLGPQRDSHLLRFWLMNHGWQISKEAFVLEDGQAYPFIVATPGKMTLSMIESWYGPCLIKQPNEDLLSWLTSEAQHLTKALSFQDHQEKRQRLEWILQYVKHHHAA